MGWLFWQRWSCWEMRFSELVSPLVWKLAAVFPWLPARLL